MDSYRVSTVSSMFHNLNNEQNNERDSTIDEIQRAFINFIKEYHTNNVYKYRERLQEIKERKVYTLEIDLEDLISSNVELANKLRNEPARMIPIFEECLKQILISQSLSINRENQEENMNDEDLSKYQERLEKEIPPIQMLIVTKEDPQNLRTLTASTIHSLVVISGIIISSSKPTLKVSNCVLQCRSCGGIKKLKVSTGFGGVKIPRQCDSNLNGQQRSAADKCPLDSYIVVPERCTYKDVQTLKIQECPELIPTGEIPRSFILFAERGLCDKVVPGMRVTVVGIQKVDEREEKTFQGSNAGRGNQGNSTIGGNTGSSDKITYIEAVNFITDSANNLSKTRQTFNFTHEEEINFINFAKSKNIYEKISSSIAPAIFGSQDIKKAIACLLFGGCRKSMTGDVKLRGDINILLLGDPSTAKSQFLKFAERVAPIAVYTSGKGSSAAGLTASIVRDPSSGEFQLEGGAMVLADGGVVCIDEFDKMRTQDRVAIHEAMEQQTISVAKAGITTTLNSRTSVLAAANPIFGHIDDFRSTQEQIDFQSTILSRFDCIFLVRDVHNEEMDKKLAAHIVEISRGDVKNSYSNDNDNDIITTNRKNKKGNNNGNNKSSPSEIDLNFLKRYIAYCKMKCFPKIIDESAQLLENFYVEDRQTYLDVKSKKGNDIPVTVRQLEAIIRLSESIAKMSLSSTVNRSHVEEAHRLFKISTLNSANANKGLSLVLNDEDKKEIAKIEESIKRRLSIGQSIQHGKLIDELGNRFQDKKLVAVAIDGLVRAEVLRYYNEKKIITRKK